MHDVLKDYQEIKSAVADIRDKIDEIDKVLDKTLTLLKATNSVDLSESGLTYPEIHL